jgi:lycopene cyclase domain-containing protein
VTYSQFLALFVLVPIAGLTLLLARDHRRGVDRPAALRGLGAGPAIGLHVLLAVGYTTPWDNYLVANGVWWYNPRLVAGLTLGWVPLEEYLFFILHTILTGLWVVWLAARVPPRAAWRPRPRLRLGAVVLGGGVWLASVGALVAGGPAYTYLGLILAWGLVPLLVQLAFGADILLRYRGLVLGGIAVPAAYLATADALAIAQGIWTIAPERSLGVQLLPTLPLEEAVFFVVTNTLITCGVVLALAKESGARFAAWRRQEPTARWT